MSRTITNPPLKFNYSYYQNGAFSALTSANYEEQKRVPGANCFIYELDLGEGDTDLTGIHIDITRTSLYEDINVSLLLYSSIPAPNRIPSKDGAQREYTFTRNGRYEIDFSGVISFSRYVYICAMCSQQNTFIIHGIEATVIDEYPNVIDVSIQERSWTYGYVDRESPIVVTWKQTKNITIARSVVQYSLKEDYSDYVDIGTVLGDSKQFTIPANTLPAVAADSTGLSPFGGIRIRVFSYTEEGRGDSDYTYCLTADSPIEVTYKEPNNNASRSETEPITFSFLTKTNPTFTQPSDVDIRWRIDGGSWQYLEHLAEYMTPGKAGTTNIRSTVTIPANSFPGAIIYYALRAYNQDGVAGDWSSEANFSTIDKPQVSTAISPINAVEDADAPILFTFGTYSQSGEASRGFELEYSIDGNTWILLAQEGEPFEQETPGGLTPADVYGAAEGSASQPLDEHSYLAPGNTFSPGVIFWHVRSYNRNLSPGEWSEDVSFVAKAAPVVQDLQVTAKPFATVIWQSNDQQNYEIFVDGKSLGIFFGTERQYPLPDYLKDGVHTIGLRVLGSFDLWSQISETQITIENTPTSTLTLKAPTNIDTALEWTGGSGDFFIYRDGLMIAHTNAHSFTDRTALGEHDYQVVERLASGDYNASAVITRTPDVYCLHIAALSGGEWIAIPHRLKNESNPEYSESQEVVYNHLAGVYEPVASIGQYRDGSGKYSAVFLFNEQEEHKRFRALRGKPVILKTADGEVVIGILHAWERKHVLNHYRYAERREIYAAYSFTIQRIGWGDYIDVPN